MKIGMNEGIESLVSGTIASLVLVSNPAIKFTVYEYFKRILLSPSQSQLSPGKAFLTGALASACATLVTYPIQVVQTKLRGVSSKFWILARKFKVEYSLFHFRKAMKMIKYLRIKDCLALFSIFGSKFAYKRNFLKPKNLMF